MNHSTNFTSRAFVMELSVKQEHAVNLILAKLLNINAYVSRSFGTSSHALSFNAKVNLLLDLKIFDKLQREKFQIFMEVRNKFAHINHVDTFEKCFAILGNYKRLKFIFGVDSDGNSLEMDMQTMFSVLSMDMTLSLTKINENITKNMAERFAKRRMMELIKERREEYKKLNPSQAEAIDGFIEYVKGVLLEEVDEKINNNIPPHL